jgi:CRISPR-associated protein Cas5h
MGRVLVFEIWGELAHFRRFFTTASPLTFSFPPPPSVRGILGALLGFSKDEYISRTNSISVGISILAPVKKIRFGLNYIFTKGSGGKFDPTLFRDRKGDKNKTIRTQVPVEFLKDVHYRVFLSGDEKILNKASEYLKEHTSEYTISLGLSECLADFRFVGWFNAKKVSFAGEVSGVIPTECVEGLNLESGFKVMKEKVPTALNENRQAVEFKDCIFNPEGRIIRGRFRNVWRIEELNETFYLFAFPSR